MALPINVRNSRWRWKKELEEDVWGLDSFLGDLLIVPTISLSVVPSYLHHPPSFSHPLIIVISLSFYPPVLALW